MNRMTWDDFNRAQAAHRAFSAFLARTRWIAWLNYTVLAWTLSFSIAWWALGLRHYWNDRLGPAGATLFQAAITLPPVFVGFCASLWMRWRVNQLKRQFPPG